MRQKKLRGGKRRFRAECRKAELEYYAEVVKAAMRPGVTFGKIGNVVIHEGR